MSMKMVTSAPNAVSSDSSYGTAAWGSVNNAKVLDAVSAGCPTSSTDITEYLKSLDFTGFDDIPAGAVIRGLAVTFHLKAQSNPNTIFAFKRVRAVKGGSISSTDLSTGASISEVAITPYTFGGVGEFFGEEWTDADIKASNFGFVFALQQAQDPVASSCGCDYVEVSVWYDDPEGAVDVPRFEGDTVFEGSVDIQGGLQLPAGVITATHLAASANIAKAQMAQRPNVEIPIPLQQFRVWDAMDTPLPDPSALDDLGFIGATFATNSPYLESWDVDSNGATNLYARAYLVIPHEYDDAKSLAFRLHAAMITNAADTTATLDISAFKSDEEGGIGSELYAGAALSFNTTSWADYDFALSTAGLLPGEILDLRIHMALNDAATGAEVKGRIGAAKWRIDLRG